MNKITSIWIQPQEIWTLIELPDYSILLHHQKLNFMPNQKVWFITDASKGLGLLLTRLLLSQDNKVAATSRDAGQLKLSAGEENENFLPLQLDITNSDSVKKAVGQTIGHFGGLDVVLNNAGFAFVGSLEELTDQEFRKAMDVNLFGTVNVTRAAMPQLRKQRSGHIINIASAGCGHRNAVIPSQVPGNAKLTQVIGLSQMQDLFFYICWNANLWILWTRFTID
jgi:NADP-dependent 3-hydroxy acid dehydrogenase YdfG